MACAGAVWQARFWKRLAGQHSWSLLLGEVLQQTVRPLVGRRCDRYWDVVVLVVAGEHLPIRALGVCSTVAVLS
jgi:hypothetical protein